MVKKIKNIKLLLSFCLAIFLLNSCTEEKEYLKNNLELKVEEKSFEELLLLKDFNTAYQKVKTEKQKNLVSRSALEDEYNFTIVEDKDVKIMDVDGKTFYNILIQRDSVAANFFENLLIMVERNSGAEELSAYIIKYAPQKYEGTNIYNFEENVDKDLTTLFGKITNECDEVCTTLCWDCIAGTEYAFPHPPSSDCDLPNFIFTTCSTLCTDYQGGSFGGSTTWTSGNLNTGSGSSSSSEIITAPVYGGTLSEEVNINYPEENIDLLEELLTDDPFALLNVPCTQIPYWQAIAQYSVPTSVKNRIEEIDSQTNWFSSANIQTLHDSNNGAVVNMDFFPVTVSEMPKKSNGEAFTQKELFDYIRTHINDFFDDLAFTPVVNSSYDINDNTLWLSDNPLGAILSINILMNEGSVVCSKYNNLTGEFYFTTINVPWDGTHPVSGNRAFGYYTDLNGNMVIYTRGVDRLTDGTYMYGPTGLSAEMTQQAIAFSQADSKWSNFQSKIKNFINEGQSGSNNGNSNVNIPVKYRPNWSKVKGVLNGTRPISDLGCN